MTINIYKRTRTLTDEVYSAWSSWSTTTDTPPYVDTDLVEYSINNTSDITEANTTINISDLTNNVTVTDNIVSGDGYFDDIMETMTKHLQAQYDADRITGQAYAQLYAQVMQNALGQSMQFLMNKRAKELSVDALEYAKSIKEQEAIVSQETRDDKIAQVGATLLKTNAEASYIDEQETQLINSVSFNNEIKVFETLGDTYGTIGAGGLTVSSDMWSTYFTLANTLANATVPTSTTVSVVTE